MEHIKGLKENRDVVFKEVYIQYHSQIYSFIILRTKSEYIAEEVTQLTFIKLWKQRELLRENLPLNIQLFGIARQVMIDLLRKEATRFKHEGLTATTPFTNCLIHAIESKDLLHLLQKDIQNMPKMRRTIFELSRNNGLTHKEIAKLFSISPKTVEHHIGKALGQLKQHLYSIML
ncbi:sigma-70 family RNA polymerase sigma factor [Sphingobacterium shayense]|uniref:sigma-70 family RNA polymerase sigma factor n=1 Tax=Sphingobacterium shayense TaxID=626343 RepID=UPI0015555986|nr:sigma-70 family RNA polymerase sigma factor [Sphingobacterium shayense]NQD70709.1 sigma-70 family RNA polymerase sigma factor [Sphingobacterium shayense]